MNNKISHCFMKTQRKKQMDVETVWIQIYNNSKTDLKFKHNFYDCFVFDSVIWIMFPSWMRKLINNYCVTEDTFHEKDKHLSFFTE